MLLLLPLLMMIRSTKVVDTTVSTDYHTRQQQYWNVEKGKTNDKKAEMLWLLKKLTEEAQFEMALKPGLLLLLLLYNNKIFEKKVRRLLC